MLRRFREILSLREKGTLFSSISTRASSSSVAGKLFRPDIIFIYPAFIKRSPCCLYHHRWPRDVIDPPRRLSVYVESISGLMCPLSPLHSRQFLVMLHRRPESADAIAKSLA